MSRDFNIVDVHHALAQRLADRPSIVSRDRSWTWSEVELRRRRFTTFLRRHGLGVRHDVDDAWVTGQDHVGLLLYNGNEYLEALLGTLGARAVPFNVNWRYVENELVSLLDDAAAVALVFHAAFAPVVERVRVRLSSDLMLVQVPDETATDLLNDAYDYEQIVEAGAVDDDPVRAPDDRYLMFTGGTTGRPKGVVWRQADLFVACLGGHVAGREFDSVDEIIARAESGRRIVSLAPPPFMHGFAQWASLATMIAGGTVVIQDDTRSFDPGDVWNAVERHHVNTLYVVGEAFARPLLDAARERTDVPELRLLFSGAAALSDRTKRAFLELIPGLRVIDLLGSSETGTQAVADTQSDGGGRAMVGSAVVLNETRTARLAPGSTETGWLASTGRTPVGYLNDRAATERTFPVVDGTRHAVPGDRVRLRRDGTIEFQGRDSSVINTAGEKVFGEEVEAAMRTLPEIADAIVVGRASDKWGAEVVAVTQFEPGYVLDVSAIRDRLREVLAAYKLPRDVVAVPKVQRFATGKPDYSWARDVTDAQHQPAVPSPP